MKYAIINCFLPGKFAQLGHEEMLFAQYLTFKTHKYNFGALKRDHFDIIDSDYWEWRQNITNYD